MSATAIGMTVTRKSRAKNRPPAEPAFLKAGPEGRVIQKISPPTRTIAPISRAMPATGLYTFASAPPLIPPSGSAAAIIDLSISR